jgi:hypothetical protein
MKPGSTLRVAPSTDHLANVAAMYAKGLGFAVLATFQDHYGFDGVILGHPHQPYHLEFTTHRGHRAGRAPSQEHLLVFYLPQREEWETQCAQMIAAGFQDVASFNPYWGARGRTFEDLDGYRVVLQLAAWPEQVDQGPDPR